MVATLAEANSYGIFGREKVDIATRFTSPQLNTLCSLALEIYKDFAPLSVEALPISVRPTHQLCGALKYSANTLTPRET